MVGILLVIKGECALSNYEEITISNFTVDGKVGGGIAFTMCSDHENRPTDTTNLIVTTYSIDMGGKSQCIILKDMSPTLTCTHYGEPAVCYERTDSP